MVPWNNWVYYFLIQAHSNFRNVGRMQIGFHARVWHNWTLAQFSESSLPSRIPRAVFMSEFLLARLIHLCLEHSTAQLQTLRRSFHQAVPEAWELHGQVYHSADPLLGAGFLYWFLFSALRLKTRSSLRERKSDWAYGGDTVHQGRSLGAVCGQGRGSVRWLFPSRLQPGCHESDQTRTRTELEPSNLPSLSRKWPASSP